MVEVPAFMAADPANVEALHAPARRRQHAAAQGPAELRELPREVLPCFKYSIIDLADDRRIGERRRRAGRRDAHASPHVQSGVRTVADMEASFARGAARGARLADRRRDQRHRGAQRQAGGAARPAGRSSS